MTEAQNQITLQDGTVVTMRPIDYRIILRYLNSLTLGTHWEGCELVHRECAALACEHWRARVALLETALREIAAETHAPTHDLARIGNLAVVALSTPPPQHTAPDAPPRAG